MAYKITKYGGKHKIKDTKTGKSMDIDIEKYMKGGTPKYELGTDGKSMCPDWDVACKKRETDLAKAGGQVRDTLNNMNSASAAVATEKNNSFDYIQGDLNLDGKVDNSFNYIQGDANLDGKVDNSFEYLRGDANLDGIVNGRDSIQQETRDDVDYSIPNPYGGVDLPSAANYLGQSIQNKDTMGTVVSSLKLATGLGRNLMSGMGQQNRYNQQMGDFYKNLKNKRTPELNMEFGGQLDSYAYGGKKDEEMATGEYMRGVSNENSEDYNAEIEKGEYFQSNEGDISEVVGDTHAQGGEKIQMEKNDRVLSDKSTIGAKAAKMLTDKYGVTLKASNTYSDVLDKVKKKSKLNDLVKQEGEILKKISAQSEIKDATTRDFNLDILSKKKQEIAEQKSPIEEERKMMFDELFDMQEAAKPKVKENKVNSFAEGGQLATLASEYGISIERAKELVQQYEAGGVRKYAEGGVETEEEARQREEEERRSGAAKSEIPAGQRGPNKGLFGKVTKESFDSFVTANRGWFDFKNFNPSNKQDVINLQKKYNSLTKGNPVTVDGKFGEQTVSMVLDPGLQPAGMVPYDYKGIQPVPLNIRGREEPKLPMTEMTVQQEDEIKKRNNGLAGTYLFPDQSPLPPSALQGTLKPEARFDRVSATEIDATPYLQSIRDNSQAQMQSLEGLSPNVRQAIMQNANAASQDQESKTRMNIDTAYLQSQEKAQYTNAQTQMREQLQNNNYRQGYESRMYSAQARTDNDINGYYNQLQDINKQRYMDINNLNLANANNEDVYFDGQSYKRKNTDKQILDNYRIKKGLV